MLSRLASSWYRLRVTRRHGRIAEGRRANQHPYESSRISSLIAAIRLIHGGADRVTKPQGTEKLFKRLPNKDKQFEIYDGYEHGEFIEKVRRLMAVMLRVGIFMQ